MGYQVLARKYRPQRFADVAGQDHVTVTLMNALTQNRIAHGYIFSGHRGIGKTTIARILACALNCRNAIGSALRPTPEPCEVCESCLEIRAGNSVDVIEIDAATNRGIDEIRELRDAARYRPSRDRFKIYILDEAHQITDAAFNALLKTLEEPPDHIVFMMATTQPEDIPQTVRSRCQHFSFHAVKLVDIMGELRGIARHEGIDADEAALSLLAEAGDGSMRDALSIMDQAIASAPLEDGKARLDASQIRELMGAVPNAVFERIMEAVNENNSAQVITVANELLDAGNSPAQLARQAVRYLRSCVIAKIAGLTPDGPGTELLQISPDEQRRAARTAALFTEEELTRFLQTMLRTFDELGYRQEQRFHFELGLLKLVHLRRLLPVEEVLSSMSGAGPRPTPRAATQTPSAKSTITTTPPPSKPAFSPFDQDKTRRYDGIAAGGPEPVRAPAPVAVAEPIRTAPTPPPPPVAVPASKPAPVPPAIPVAVPTPKPVVELAPAPVPEPAPEPEPVAEPAVNPFGNPVAEEPVLKPVIQSAPEPISKPAIELTAEPEPVLEVSIPQPTFSIVAAADPEPEPAPAAPTNAPAPSSNGEAEKLQRAASDALSASKQGSASDAIEDSTFTIDGGEIRVQTHLSKTMLPVVMNAEAEKTVKDAMRAAGAGALKLIFLPGASRAVTAKAPRAARSGSAQAKAEQHPLIQQAQQLFNAEIQTVIDLSEGK
ncbi:DNA polymerase III subunit gamma/tau [Granulicella sp. WH15]|uniref:DNA polymerase III subunit gamma/tau n=1 Tax=Granulicella sp. WH15 TaxID=2602070 RepID=UPI00136746FE|nr:DNA polymerase III subunit gamma/tau [Granulicella sp. WH15]QHN03471.1 DNA polymerase III subunit gamma/tau [Granulicella sp. WH15]